MPVEQKSSLNVLGPKILCSQPTHHRATRNDHTAASSAPTTDLILKTEGKKMEKNYSPSPLELLASSQEWERELVVHRACLEKQTIGTLGA